MLTAGQKAANTRRANKLLAIEGAALPALAQNLMVEELVETVEDVAVVELRIDKRFKALDRMAAAVVRGLHKALIVSGPGGLGKSYGVQQAIAARKAEVEDDGGTFVHDYVSGSISAVGLYTALWNTKDGGVLILDDCDAAFEDADSLNLLKAVLDSNGKRMVSWRKAASWLEANEIDDTFEFCGQVIFLTNVDFERIVNSGSPRAAHFKALMDRCLYLSLSIHSVQDYMVRINQVVYGQKMLSSTKPAQVDEIMAFVNENRKRFYHLSLRLVRLIADCQAADSKNWRDDVEMTKMRAA